MGLKTIKYGDDRKPKLKSTKYPQYTSLRLLESEKNWKTAKQMLIRQIFSNSAQNNPF